MKMDNQLALNSSQLDLAWLGGLLDGEGSFNLHWKHDKTRRKSKAHVQVRMGNTNPEILSEYLRILNNLCVTYYQYKQQQKSNHKIATIVVVNRLVAVHKLCNLVYSYLRGKKSHCFLVMNFVDSRLKRTEGQYNVEYSDNEVAWLESLREMNIKGVRDCMLSGK